MTKRAQDTILGFLAALVLLSIFGVVWYNGREPSAALRTHRRIDVKQVDEQVRSGNLSDVPARHFRIPDFSGR